MGFPIIKYNGETIMKETFKAGDKVYTVFDEKIHAVMRNPNHPYSLKVAGIIFTEDGYCNHRKTIPQVFRATKENKAKLEALLGVEYEAPTLTDGEQVIEALKLGKPVLCEVWDDDVRFGVQVVIGYGSTLKYKFRTLDSGGSQYAKLVSIKDYTYLENACIIK